MALIVTARLDASTHAWLDALRREHFPPERNHLEAHLTLFHALPDEHADEVAADLRAAVAAAALPIDAVVGAPFGLGRGVAFAIQAPPLLALRERLAGRWAPLLTAQDAQPWRRPHVTVQNKVTPERARALRADLARDHVPVAARIEGLSLWRYLGGPWGHLAVFGPGGASFQGIQR